MLSNYTKKLIVFYFALALGVIEILSLIVLSANAYPIGNNSDIELSVNSISEKSVSWTWNNSVYESCNVTKDDISYLENYNNNNILFTDLRSNEIHKLSLICNNTIYQDSQTTQKSSYDSVNSFLDNYKYFILAFILLILCMALNSPIFGLAGVAVLFLGFIYNISPLIIEGATPTLDALIYSIGLIVAIIIGFAKWR